ncbi:MAG: NAD(P)H-dependent glycerol-3-phosphate dehydrogenase [Planctomycetota bacterium]|jgi:glycerol-3-phosphate dehydrogenase (NAD(P)+)
MPVTDRPDLTRGPIAILGDGQMALVMADALAARGLGVRMWCPRAEDAADLARSREQAARLPGFRLASGVEVTGDLEGAVAGASAILNAIPTQYIRSVWSRLAGVLDPAPPVICVSKGIENGTLLLPSGVLASAVGRPLRVCALSGPTIATELARRLPASMLAASEDPGLAEAVQDAFNVPWLRIYTHEDVDGVELAGAAKNVIAIAAGIIDGLGQGDNAKSALLARGLAEIARLGQALGARTETFFGLAGVGDLATTCFSPSGRNRTCGQRIGEGEPLERILDSTVSVVEGVPTTRSIADLAERLDVDMPITRAVRSVLFDGVAPPEAIRALMARPSKAERVG